MNKEQVVKDLTKARKILDEKGWTQGCAARNKNGGEVGSTSRAAVSWCSVGVIERAVGADAPCLRFSDAWRVFQDAIPGVYGRLDGVTWNDAPRRTKAQVLKVFDKAIASVSDA